MVEFVSRYENFAGLEYDSRITGHGEIYGSSSCGKSTLVRNLCLNGMFQHCKTLVFLNGKTSSLPKGFEATMKQTALGNSSLFVSHQPRIRTD